MRHRVAELDHAQEVIHVLPGDGDGEVFAFLHYLACNLPADITDLPLQVGTPASQVYSRIIADRIWVKTMLFSESSRKHLFFARNCFAISPSPPQYSHEVAALPYGPAAREEECITFAVATKKPGKDRKRIPDNDPRT